MTKQIKIAAYGEGVLFHPNLAKHKTEIKQAGWTTMILGLFHIDVDGQIGLNNANEIITDGVYKNDESWLKDLADLLNGGTIDTLLASFGGGGVGDFNNIKNIYEANGNSLSGTTLEKNFKEFRVKFPFVSNIDMDCEDKYDQPSFVAFCEMVIDAGFALTFCPYAASKMDFWTGSLAALNKSNPGAVKWWNLQCYDGGGGNTVADWVTGIKTAIPSFDTTNFIQTSDWVRFWDDSKYQKKWRGQCPPDIQKHLKSFANDPSVGGSFIWTLDAIYDYAESLKKHPDPNNCGTLTQVDVVNAIKKAYL